MVAKELCTRLKPVCERLIVAGSLRRRKEDVGDVEILYIPRMEVRQEDLLSTCTTSLADEEIGRMLAEGILEKRQRICMGKTAGADPQRCGVAGWGEKNKLAVHVASGIPVDLFATMERAWWNYLVCRTGPAESNTRIATEAKIRGWKWNPYGEGFTNLEDGKVVPMTSELDVFSFVGLPYYEPWER